jgi:hypothetical protein
VLVNQRSKGLELLSISANSTASAMIARIPGPWKTPWREPWETCDGRNKPCWKTENHEWVCTDTTCPFPWQQQTCCQVFLLSSLVFVGQLDLLCFVDMSVDHDNQNNNTHDASWVSRSKGKKYLNLTALAW